MSEAPTPNPSSTWTKVGDDKSATPPPPMPTWAKAAGLGLLALIMVLAGILGASLGRSGPAPTLEPSESPSPSPTPPFELEAPVQVGEFVAGDVTETQGPAPLNQRIVRANYTDGTDKLLFVITWPEEDLDEFVAGAAIEGAEELTPGTMCGTSLDTEYSACARLSGDVGLMLLGVTELRPTVVAAFLTEFERALTTQE